jgi:hypothetical protein
MLHLRDTLPKLLESGHSSSELFPTDIYSTNVVLKLPAPLPIRVSSLCKTTSMRTTADIRSLHYQGTLSLSQSLEMGCKVSQISRRHRLC